MVEYYGLVKQFLTQGLDSQPELCAFQRDLEVLPQTDHVSWQPKSRFK